MITYFFQLIFGYDNTLNPWPLCAVSAAIGFGIGLVVIALKKDSPSWQRQIKKFGISHLLSACVLITAVTGFLSFHILLLANRYFDTSSPESHTLTLIHKYKKWHRRNPDEYILEVDLNPENKPELSPKTRFNDLWIHANPAQKLYTELNVSPDLYATLPEGYPITIAIHQGALGYAWVDQIKRAKD